MAGSVRPLLAGRPQRRAGAGAAGGRGGEHGGAGRAASIGRQRPGGAAGDRTGRGGLMRLAAIAAAAVLAAAAAPVAAQAPKAVTLSIVGTNDLHGRISSLPALGGYLANLRRARAADGGGVVLVDAGDMFQGTLESNL